MTQYNTLNVMLSNLQLNNLKSVIKNGTEATLKLLSNDVDDSNVENNFPHKLLTDTQILKFRKAISNSLSANKKLSKTQLHKIIQSGGFLSRLFKPLLKSGLPFIKNVLKPLAKSVLIPLGFTASATAADAAIHGKIFVSGTTTLIKNRQITWKIWFTHKRC